MKSWEIIGYAYEAALHCPDCANKRFKGKELNDKNPPLDREKNPISPVFYGDDPGDCGDYCDDCLEPLDNTEVQS